MALSRSSTASSKYSALPSATSAVHAPAKQSAWSSVMIVSPSTPARNWMAWPNSWAKTMPRVNPPNSS